MNRGKANPKVGCSVFPLFFMRWKMKANMSFEIMKLEDGIVAVPVGENGQQFDGVLKVNEIAADILKLLEEETTEEQIADRIMHEYDGNAEEIHSHVHEFLESLRTEGILE